MKKNILLITLVFFYGIGVITSIIILATGTKKQEQSTTNTIETISSLSSLSKKNKNIIGVININAPISFMEEPSSFIIPQQGGAKFWMDQMHYATTNTNIKAVIIRVNSPGGTVGASQELHAGVQRIKAAGKPVITSVADLSASGAYYATVGSDRIFANPGSLIGSIGVILGGVEFSELLSKIGIKYQAITSGVNKDILSPYKKMSPEQQQFLQTMVNNTYNQFLTAVAEGRGKDKETIRPLADGSIFTGEQAVANGLIDAVGSFYDVVTYTKEQYQLDTADVEVIAPTKSGFNISDLITVFTPQPKINLINTEPKFGSSPVLYLYQF
ncbi:MAG: signal peptide peptidase SppA [Brevinema sp.]